VLKASGLESRLTIQSMDAQTTCFVPEVMEHAAKITCTKEQLTPQAIYFIVYSLKQFTSRFSEIK
jgi:hypothetical protein